MRIGILILFSSSIFGLDVLPSLYGGFGNPIGGFGAVDVYLGKGSSGHESYFVSGLTAGFAYGANGEKYDLGWGIKGGVFLPSMKVSGNLTFYNERKESFGLDAGGKYLGGTICGELMFVHCQIGALGGINDKSEDIIGYLAIGIGL